MKQEEKSIISSFNINSYELMYIICSLEKRMISKNPSLIAPNFSARLYRNSGIFLIRKLIRY